MFFTAINVCMLPIEIWSLIATYLQLIDMFNLSVCSAFFYAVIHKNTCLDEKINILKRLISNDLMFFGQIRCFFRLYYTRCVKCLVGTFQKLRFFCVEKTLKDEDLVNIFIV